MQILEPTSRRVRFLIPILGVWTFFSLMPFGTFAAIPDGSLVRAEDDKRVFYIENNTKRWIDSPETFRIQGFRWNDIRLISPEELASYADDEAIREKTNVIVADEESVLPDLVPFPLYDFRFATRQGRTILKFSSTYWNQGRGPLIVMSGPDTAHTHFHQSDTKHEAEMTNAETGDIDRGEHFQQILRQDGTERRKILGGFHWHFEHSHYHYDDFAHYLFEPIAASASVPTRIEKATRCLWDTLPVNLGLPNAPQSRVFSTCKDAIRQGVSVGWGDEYDHTLADQYLDVHDVPPGIYRLSLVVDPYQKIIELDRDNNVSVAIIELDPKKRRVKVLAAGGPFVSSKNTLTNGTLIRSDKDQKVYVAHNNKKRWLRTEEIFTSYGYSWDNILILPQTIVDHISFDNLVRADGKIVYALNDSGYKRHLANPEIFSSYEFHWGDIADISENELAQYPEARLVRVVDRPDVYYIEDRASRRIDSPDVFAANDFSWNEVHIINQTDFSSYSVGPDITTKYINP